MNKVNKLESEQCKYFDYCNAPLCPLNAKHLIIDAWYPDEEICRLKTVPKWIKTQKKIAKKTKDKNKYYTYKMLNRNCKVKIGIAGLDPDKPEKLQLRAWLKKHPQKKALSEKQKKVLVEARKKSPTASLKKKIVACL